MSMSTEESENSKTARDSLVALEALLDIRKSPPYSVFRAVPQSQPPPELLISNAATRNGYSRLSMVHPNGGDSQPSHMTAPVQPTAGIPCRYLQNPPAPSGMMVTGPVPTPEETHSCVSTLLPCHLSQSQVNTGPSATIPHTYRVPNPLVGPHPQGMCVSIPSPRIACHTPDPWPLVSSADHPGVSSTEIYTTTQKILKCILPIEKNNLSKIITQSKESFVKEERRTSCYEITSVRKNEVEAALHSKPQRGRKRDNLSAAERVELTRTRNREHAKSTRSRKKVRYDHLLSSEKKYQLLKASEELDQDRRNSLLGLFELRSLCASRKTDCNSCHLSDSTTMSDFEAYLEDANFFRFVPNTYDPFHPSDCEQGDNGVEQMLRHDRAQCHRISLRSHNKKEGAAFTSCCLKIQDGMQGIALTRQNDGIGYAQYDILYDTREKEEENRSPPVTAIWNCMVRVGFSKGSSKIIFVDSRAGFSHDNDIIRSGSIPSLETSLSSIISLENSLGECCCKDNTAAGCAPREEYFPQMVWSGIERKDAEGNDMVPGDKNV